MNLNFVVGCSLAGLVAACGGGGSSATSTGFAIAPVTGTTLTAVAGDALALKAVETFDDGTTADVDDSATVAFTAPVIVQPLPADSSEPSPFPATGAAPTAVFIDNSLRTDRPDDLTGVLFVLDAGTTAGGSVTVSVAISGSSTGRATASVPIGAGPTGDAAHGATLYATACASCHGAAGAGSPANADGVTFTLEGSPYAYPAPGLNTADGNVASDPDWNSPLFAVAARADLDNGGLVLRAPMPDWLSDPPSSGAAVLTTQDFADIYAFLQTQ